jgi:uncharacterized protein (TIGR02808 family)
MSTLESVIWHVLGYAAIPVILITGFIISSVVFYFLQKMTIGGGDEQ